MGNKVTSDRYRVFRSPHLGQRWFRRYEGLMVIFLLEDLAIVTSSRKNVHRLFARVHLNAHTRSAAYTIHTAATRCDYRQERLQTSKVCARKSPRSLNLTAPQHRLKFASQSWTHSPCWWNPSPQQLWKRRGSFRRAIEACGQNAAYGALGIRVNVAGRLGGAECARTEWYREAACRSTTLRATSITHMSKR